MQKLQINVGDLVHWMQTESLLYARSKDAELRVNCFGAFTVNGFDPKSTFVYHSIQNAVDKFNELQRF